MRNIKVIGADIYLNREFGTCSYWSSGGFVKDIELDLNKKIYASTQQQFLFINITAGGIVLPWSDHCNNGLDY